MIRLQFLLIFVFLTAGPLVHGQHGHERDTLGHFEFLKQHQNVGDYILEQTKNLFGDSTLRAHFLSKVDFRDAQFESLAYFGDAQFDSLAIFRDAQFEFSANFRRAQFDSLADFIGAQFQSRASFSYAQFESQVSFPGAQFKSLADFPGVQFESRASFYSAKFDSLADFLGSHFESRVDFLGSHFEFLADFSSVRFNSRVNFSRTHFDSTVNFFNAHFDSRVDFSYAQINGAVDFRSVFLPDTLIFENVKTSRIIDLTKSKLDSEKKFQRQFCMIDLRGAPLDKFKFYYDKFRVYWPHEIDRTEYERLTNVYEALLKKFKEEGYLTSYVTLDKEYQAFKDLQNPDASPIKKLLNKANFYWNNYGYNKEWIWGWTLIFLAISTLINWLAFPYLVKDVYPVPMIDKALFKGNPVKRFEFKKRMLKDINLLEHSRYFVLAFFYTCLIFFGLKLSTERINFEKYGGVTLIFAEYLMGLICLGYLANFIISSGVIGQ